MLKNLEIRALNFSLFLSMRKFWRGKPSPRAYCVGRYPFQRGHPATPRSQDARSFQDSPPAATAALPDSFLTMAGSLPAARDVRRTVLSLPVERRRRTTCRPHSTLRASWEHQLPDGRWCFCQPRLGSLRCARLGSWDVPQRAKDKGYPSRVQDARGDLHRRAPFRARRIVPHRP